MLYLFIFLIFGRDNRKLRLFLHELFKMLLIRRASRGGEFIAYFRVPQGDIFKLLVNVHLLLLATYLS